MVIKLGRDELKEMIKESVKEELSPSEVFAGLIWHFCINSQDHYYKGEYNDLPVSFQYDNDGVSLLDVYYLQQKNEWLLFFPDYKHLLRIAPLVLKWLDDTYLAYIASQQQISAPRSPRRRKRRSSTKPRRRRATTPFSSILDNLPTQQQSYPRQTKRPRTGNDQQSNQGENQWENQNNRG